MDDTTKRNGRKELTCWVVRVEDVVVVAEGDSSWVVVVLSPPAVDVGSRLRRM